MSIDPHPKKIAVPKQLIVVEWVFLFIGVIGYAGTSINYLHGKHTIYVEIVGLFIFLGLRQRSQIFRYFALMMLVIWLVLLPFAAFDKVIEIPLDQVGYGPPPGLPFKNIDITLRLFGVPPPNLPKSIDAIFCPVAAICLFILLSWQFYVLTRPVIRRIFSEKQA